MSDTVSSAETAAAFSHEPRGLRLHPAPGTEDRRGARFVIAAMPAFNEELYIAKTILQAQEFVERVVVVDDGSTDETARIADRMGATVIRHPENRGYGASLSTIFEAARTLDADALVVLDADGQHNPLDIERVLEPVLRDEADVVIGSRFLEDAPRDHIPRYRQVGMKVLDTATSLVGGVQVTDTQSGFRAYGRKAIETVHLIGDGMSAGSEILIQVSDRNLVIAEVPINVRYDIEDTSTEHPVKHGIKVLYVIVALVGYRRPLIAFGMPGAAFVALGLVLASVAFSEYYTTSKFSFPSSMGSALSLILGLLLGGVGLILNYLVVFVRDRGK
jgi:glycosyltransferase involved in cell wall biosynthesis